MFKSPLREHMHCTRLPSRLGQCEVVAKFTTTVIAKSMAANTQLQATDLHAPRRQRRLGPVHACPLPSSRSHKPGDAALCVLYVLYILLMCEPYEHAHTRDARTDSWRGCGATLSPPTPNASIFLKKVREYIAG